MSESTIHWSETDNKILTHIFVCGDRNYQKPGIIYKVLNKCQTELGPLRIYTENKGNVDTIVNQYAGYKNIPINQLNVKQYINSISNKLDDVNNSTKKISTNIFSKWVIKLLDVVASKINADIYSRVNKHIYTQMCHFDSKNIGSEVNSDKSLNLTECHKPDLILAFFSNRDDIRTHNILKRLDNLDVPIYWISNTSTSD